MVRAQYKNNWQLLQTASSMEREWPATQWPSEPYQFLRCNCSQDSMTVNAPKKPFNYTSTSGIAFHFAAIPMLPKQWNLQQPKRVEWENVWICSTIQNQWKRLCIVVNGSCDTVRWLQYGEFIHKEITVSLIVHRFAKKLACITNVVN